MAERRRHKKRIQVAKPSPGIGDSRKWKTQGKLPGRVGEIEDAVGWGSPARSPVAG